VLPSEALEGRGIEAVREALVPTAGALVVAPRMVGSHQLISRTRHEGRVDLFLAPHATAAADALAELLDLRERGEAPTVRLHAMAWRNTDGRLAAQGGLAELEAMMREAAAGEAWPERFEAYLRARQKRVGSSYWSDAAVESGIDPLELRAHAEGDAAVALIDADAQMLAELATGGPVVVLVANQELVPCASRTEVRHALTAARALAERVGVAEAELPSRRAEAVPLLVRALEAAPDAASERIVRGLRALTGESFGGDADRWRSWLDARAR
jgi:hypothetical protein